MGEIEAVNGVVGTIYDAVHHYEPVPCLHGSVGDFSRFAYTGDVLEWATVKEKCISLECMDHNKIVANRLLNHLLPDSMKV